MAFKVKEVDRVYGEVLSSVGNVICEGKTLEQVKELALEVDESQTTFYDLSGDLAFAPKLVCDLVRRIEELEAGQKF